jgi:hypothetical protein
MAAQVDGHFSGMKSTLSMPAKQVLAFVAVGQRGSVADNVESLCGLDSYLGSDAFPGYIDVSDADLGAHTVVWIVPTCNAGAQGGGVFNFRISQDGTYIEEKAGNTFRLWDD